MAKAFDRVMAIVLLVWFIGAGVFAYTFVQPRYTATITAVGRPFSRQNTSRSRRGSRKSYTVVPLEVRYTDRDGTDRTAEVQYARPKEAFTVGQEITIIHGPGRLIPYPWTGLRMFSGVICLALGMFLFFTWLDKRGRTPAAHRE